MLKNKKPKLIIVAGPTASGKTALAIEIAKKYNGEVVSADSRQVYRGLDIGTGKATRREMAGIPHHLLDVASVRRQFSVAEYKRLADQAITDILSRGKMPILCGGTGFYIDAVVHGVILPEVPPDSALRTRLAQKTPAELLVMLQKLDPRRAKTIEQKNPRRLIRAIEISRVLGRVPAAKKQAHFDTLWIGTHIPEKELHERIYTRLYARIKQGMLMEVKRLHARGLLSWKRAEELGLEYRFISRHLRGTISREEMLSEIELEIRRYAKRQYAWFKRNDAIRWLHPRTDEKKILALVRNFLRIS